MAESIINFNKRTFSEAKAELLRYIEEQYPEILEDITDSSIGSILIDINAGISNQLHTTIDRAFQETQLDNAQQKSSIREIAKNKGFNIPGKKPSVTLIDFSIEVPALGDGPDESYFATVAPGAQGIGGGKIFETTDTLDFNSPISSLGFPNRSIIPNQDNNGITQSYTIIKREVVFNGQSTIFKKVIKKEDVIPFLEVILPEQNVVSVEQVALLEGTNYTGNPPLAEFNNPDNTYYEVDYLSKPRVFIEDPNIGFSTGNTQGIKAGKWIETTKKFVKETTLNGFAKLTFGGGNGDRNLFKDGFAKAGVTGVTALDIFLENTSLGEKLRADHTLFIRYRIGGGASSNVGANVLNELGQAQITVNGRRQDINRQVQRSLTIKNPIPAYGGRDELSVDEIRNLTKYNFGAQDRSVVINDYLLQVNKMPGKFGSPFRLNAYKENNKVVIPILGIDENGKLNNSSTTLLKENIAEYLSGYRSINDYVEIKDGKIINLAFELELFISDDNESQIANNIIRTIIQYFEIAGSQMNEDILLSPLVKTINDVVGVNNIISIKIFNKVGGEYSLNEIDQEYLDESTRQIKIVNETIYSAESSMFEIKFPEKDIKLFLKKRVDVVT